MTTTERPNSPRAGDPVSKAGASGKVIGWQDGYVVVEWTDGPQRGKQTWEFLSGLKRTELTNARSN